MAWNLKVNARNLCIFSWGKVHVKFSKIKCIWRFILKKVFRHRKQTRYITNVWAAPHSGDPGAYFLWVNLFRKKTTVASTCRGSGGVRSCISLQLSGSPSPQRQAGGRVGQYTQESRGVHAGVRGWHQSAGQS